MKRMLPLVLLVGLLSGCSAMSPHIIDTPYPAADGTNGEVVDPSTGSSVKLRNFLLVASDQGKPAVLVGALANQGNAPVKITLTILDGDGQPAAAGDVTAQPGVLTQVGLGDIKVPVPSSPARAGAVLQLVASSANSGKVPMSLPVVSADPGGPYATITPSAG